MGPVSITGSRNQYFTTTGGTPLQTNCVVNGSVELCSQSKTAIKPALQGFNPTDVAVDGAQPGQPILGETIGPWQRPGAGQIGNAGRNALRGPGFFQTDLAVAKSIPLTERVAMQFRADAFNVFNKVNLASPSAVVDSSSGGEISSLATGAIQRQLQFSLRVSF